MGELKKQRPWFQIHLSTAISMMFVAGGLILANTNTREHSELGNVFFGNSKFTRGLQKSEFFAMGVGHDWEGITRYLNGWPCDARAVFTMTRVTRTNEFMFFNSLVFHSSFLRDHSENKKPSP